jgi:hypothetical protein
MVNILSGHFEVTDAFIKNHVTVSLIVDFHGNPIKMKVISALLMGLVGGLLVPKGW